LAVDLESRGIIAAWAADLQSRAELAGGREEDVADSPSLAAVYTARRVDEGDKKDHQSTNSTSWLALSNLFSRTLRAARQPTSNRGSGSAFLVGASLNNWQLKQGIQQS
jgi:hypothetical protein